MTADLVKETGQWMNKKTVVEYADSPSELMAAITQRHNPKHPLYHRNFIEADHAIEIFTDEGTDYLADFMGLEEDTPKKMYNQLWGMFQAGTDKTELVAQINTAANDFHNTMGALTIGYIEEPAPTGSRLDPNKVIKGDPNCFIRSKPIEVGFPVIKIAIDASILCTVDAETVRDRGEIIAKALVRAELGGYKTRVSAFSATIFKDVAEIVVMALNLKREDEPMNYSRVLYPILEPSFLRGVSFTWRATLPELEHTHEIRMGASIYRDFNADARREFYDDVFDQDTLVFCIGAMCEEMTHEEAERYVEELLQSRQAAHIDGSLRYCIDNIDVTDFVPETEPVE